MKNWIPKRISLIIASGFLALGFVLYGAALFLGLGEINKIENYYTDTESKYSRVERANAIKSLAEINRAYINTLREFFVQKGDEVKFIEEIERTGDKSGVEFQILSIDVKTGTKESKDALKEDVAVKGSVQGSWPEVMRFLELLDKMYFGVAIQNITLDTDGAGEWSGVVDMVVFREK